MMSLPSMRPLTEGTSLSAWVTALTKNDMKPSFTPCFFMNSSCTCLAEVHHGAHVHLVEGGENGGGLLGVDEVRGDLAAQHRHLAAGGAAVADFGWSDALGRGGGAVKSGLTAAAGAALEPERRCGAATGAGLTGGRLAGAALPLAAPVSMVAMTAPMETSSPSGDEDFQTAGDGGFEFVGDLVGFEHDEHFALHDVNRRPSCAISRRWRR